MIDYFIVVRREKMTHVTTMRQKKTFRFNTYRKFQHATGASIGE